MAQKIKVMECIRQGQIGGGESHLLSLVENLDQSKFQPIVLSFTDGPMIDQLKQMQVETHVIHTQKPFDFSKWKEVKQLLKDKQVDIVHAHGTRANSNVLWAAHSLSIPVIYTVHGWSFHADQNPFVRTIRVAGEKYLTKKSDQNISVSSSNQQSGKVFIKSFNSIVINNGIDQKKFNPKKTYKNIRQELGIKEKATLVLFIARFTLQKQPLALIQAFAKALPSNPNLHLLMIGDGDQKQEAVELINKSGLKNNITLLPFRQDVPDVLAAADIFVLPSLWEGLPIGLLEAMAMGKAIIASNVDGTGEVIQNNKNGLLIDTSDLITNLANALLLLSNDQKMREQFSNEAIKTINERYNAVNMTRLIEEVYSKLVNLHTHNTK
jgi:glycosyltransferase involved in cell wall biosynthesis